ncbi:helix-turn-helix transcriptional regulator [Paenibacillus lignilyticus]|uniref:Helix-turn-helix transcriptional regulator n=1 Tax=Paenibacillus lignilyticus TaxID=1172615 RepID=A0ABS5C672_9BACL|nr:response regulator transcription factor [Paenibacillus lignilyticus]MBP3961502.1 helix-turn-helix transcriptional regulator [Paenibacillus lignilyticus]
MERSNERFKSGRGRIFFLEAQSEAAADYIYPEEQERAVLAALRLGHQEECISHLEQFVKHLVPYSYSESRLALTHFMINLGKTVRQIRHDYSEPHLWSLTHIEMQLDSIETIDNVMEWLHSVIASVLETNQNAKSNRHSKLMNDIRAIVESNIGNVNLSSKFVADALGMSVPYLRPLFKEIMNQSLSDYITGLRLEEVKRQLVETNRTVEDISRNAGFSALNSFYAIFKKNYGITPAQYRKENQPIRDDIRSLGS